MTNQSHLLTTLTEQIEHCKAQGFTDAKAAQDVIDLLLIGLRIPSVGSVCRLR